jgi:plastocyanin
LLAWDLNLPPARSVDPGMTTSDFPRARWILTITIASVALFAALYGSQASAGEVAQTSRAKTVKIAGFAFKPGKLTVARGTTVTFSNSDSAPHTATRRGSFDTGRIGPGGAKSVKFSRSGTFSYLCAIHPTMRGKIVVN